MKYRRLRRKTINKLSQLPCLFDNVLSKKRNKFMFLVKIGRKFSSDTRRILIFPKKCFHFGCGNYDWKWNRKPNQIYMYHCLTQWRRTFFVRTDFQHVVFLLLMVVISFVLLLSRSCSKYCKSGSVDVHRVSELYWGITTFQYLVLFCKFKHLTKL